MSIDYTPHTIETLCGLKDHRLSRSLHRIKSLLIRCIRPAVPGKSLGVHLPDSVWHRQSAVLMCLWDAAYEETT
jgi:hypothetical protein